MFGTHSYKLGNPLSPIYSDNTQSKMSKSLYSLCLERTHTKMVTPYHLSIQTIFLERDLAKIVSPYYQVIY